MARQLNEPTWDRVVSLYTQAKRMLAEQPETHASEILVAELTALVKTLDPRTESILGTMCLAICADLSQDLELAQFHYANSLALIKKLKQLGETMPDPEEIDDRQRICMWRSQEISTKLSH